MTERRATAVSFFVALLPQVIWAAHFLVVYPTAAVLCARDIDGAAGISAAVNLAATTVAVIAIGIVAARAVPSLYGGADEDDEQPHRRAETDSHSDIRVFLDRVTLLVSALSLVAILYGALPAIFAAHC